MLLFVKMHPAQGQAWAAAVYTNCKLRRLEVMVRKPYIQSSLGHRYDTMGQDTRRDAPSDAAVATAAIQKTPDSRHIALTANRLDARDLFVATREIVIAHGEETYRLRLTSQNKLILTK